MVSWIFDGSVVSVLVGLVCWVGCVERWVCSGADFGGLGLRWVGCGVGRVSGELACERLGV
jgi:hypothetical protein